MKTAGTIDAVIFLTAVKLFERTMVHAEAGCGNEHIPMIIDNNINIPDRIKS